MVKSLQVSLSKAVYISQLWCRPSRIAMLIWHQRVGQRRFSGRHQK